MTAEALRPLERLLHEQDEPQLTPDEYKAVFRRHAAGVAVVTLRDGDRPVGFTATSVISVSASPPILAFSLASTSSSWPAISRTDTLAISLLTANQGDISARFATSGIDRFADGGWRALDTGEPVIEDAGAWVRGRILQRVPVGDSYLVTVRALEHGTSDSAGPLVYLDRTYHPVGDYEI